MLSKIDYNVVVSSPVPEYLFRVYTECSSLLLALDLIGTLDSLMSCLSVGFQFWNVGIIILPN